MCADAPESEPRIGTVETVWRRVRPKEFEVEADGRIRPSSQAFQNQEGLSVYVFVYVSTLVIAAGKSPQDVLDGFDGYGLVSLPVQLIEELGQRLELAQAEGVGHAHVVGEKSKSVRRKMARAAQWLIMPS